MGMAANQLFTDPVKHVGDVECVFFGGNFRVEYQMKHQIAQFLFDFREIILKNGIGKLIGFLNG